MVTATDENEWPVSIEIEITEPEESINFFSSLPGEYSDCNSGQLSVFAENGTDLIHILGIMVKLLHLFFDYVLEIILLL